MNYHTLIHENSNRARRKASALFSPPPTTRTLQHIRAQERDVDLKREYRNYKRLGVPFGFDEFIEYRRAAIESQTGQPCSDGRARVVFDR
jgi:hypothetical protein